MTGFAGEAVGPDGWAELPMFLGGANTIAQFLIIHDVLIVHDVLTE
jgi:hypothetical protein